jgi:hypothetical protein
MIELKKERKQYLDALKDRLARVKRGEVLGSDHVGPYTKQEKADEIARIEAEIARAVSGDV